MRYLLSLTAIESSEDHAIVHLRPEIDIRANLIYVDEAGRGTRIHACREVSSIPPAEIDARCTDFKGDTQKVEWSLYPLCRRIDFFSQSVLRLFRSFPIVPAPFTVHPPPLQIQSPYAITDLVRRQHL